MKLHTKYITNVVYNFMVILSLKAKIFISPAKTEKSNLCNILLFANSVCFLAFWCQCKKVYQLIKWALDAQKGTLCKHIKSAIFFDV